MNVICDLDGTLSLLQHRRHLVEVPMIECSKCNGEGYFHIKHHMGSNKTSYITYNADCSKCKTTGKVKDKAFKPKWDEFYEACDKDLPNWPVIHTINCLHSTGHKIIIMSGRMRTESVGVKTDKWLKEHGVKYDDLIMRPEGDYTPDHELKEAMFKKMFVDDLSNFFGVFDDRKRVCDMWRSLGLTCFQVAEGDF